MQIIDYYYFAYLKTMNILAMFPVLVMNTA